VTDILLSYTSKNTCVHTLLLDLLASYQGDTGWVVDEVEPLGALPAVVARLHTAFLHTRQTNFYCALGLRYCDNQRAGVLKNNKIDKTSIRALTKNTRWGTNGIGNIAAEEILKWRK